MYLFNSSGTNGAISLVGTLASILGGGIVGLAYYLALLLLVNEDYLTSAPPQWPLIPIGGLLGLLGSTIDSILGATVQYSGKMLHARSYLCNSDNFMKQCVVYKLIV